VRRRRDRQIADKSGPLNRNRLRWVRLCLIASVFVYLGLADRAARWLPNEPFVAFVFVFFAAHTAAYLLLKEVRGYDDDNPD
jgi:hypothetical protein